MILSEIGQLNLALLAARKGPNFVFNFISRRDCQTPALSAHYSSQRPAPGFRGPALAPAVDPNVRPAMLCLRAHLAATHNSKLH